MSNPKDFSVHIEFDLTPESKEVLADWVRRKEADIAADELR